MLSGLNEQQKKAVIEPGNALVIACPGSGKTRVLTYKVAYSLEASALQKKYVVAVTFTNRAADEIQNRINLLDISNDNLWTGTIHAFCLEWILRPYAGYCDRIKNGFTIIDEYAKEKLINEIKESLCNKSYDIVTGFNRNGEIVNKIIGNKKVADQYHKILEERKWIDFDLILYLSYILLCAKPYIVKTLGEIISLICIDEYQDTQDIPYGILCKIIESGKGKTKIFLVGDPDQAIYGSLGGMAKSCVEIQNEIGDFPIQCYELSGNYRSCQRIIDFYRNFQMTNIDIAYIGKKKENNGLITLNRSVHADLIHKKIADYIRISIKKGIPEHEICVIAPQWRMITAIAKKLIRLLPNVNFDAPGLSPLRRNKENFWFKVARLFLTEPSPKMLLNRLQWANEIICELQIYINTSLGEDLGKARTILKVINEINPNDNDGITYLENAFTEFMVKLNFTLEQNETLYQHWESFFSGAEKARAGGEVPIDIASFRRMFKERRGVVINTCHGVKGEEYETVIAYGLLQGFIPHWNQIYGGSQDEAISCSNKLLYVISSRAKSNLHLIAEVGRKTIKGTEYKINPQLDACCSQYK